MNLDPLRIIIILAIVVGSVILHELSHGIVAYWLGDRTAKDAGRLTLNPIKHIDPFMSILVPVILYILRAPVFGGAKPVPINPRNLKWHEWGMAIVALAGPAMNFCLALVTFLVAHFSGILYGPHDGIIQFIFVEIIYINLGFMIFNLIPIPPLDGSRLLYAIAPDSVRVLMMNLERYGVIIIYLLIFLFGDVLSNLMVNGMTACIDFFYLITGH